MLVNGEKTELFFFNCGGKDFELTSFNGDICQVRKTTKSLIVIIDSKLNYRTGFTETIEKAKRYWKELDGVGLMLWSLGSQFSIKPGNKNIRQ